MLLRLANLALPPPGIRFKASTMPFTQRENIAHFLRACEMPPLNLPAHDRFLTVDLYDNKDPAQVIQCIGAFSRAAHAVNPSRFPQVIGPKAGTGRPASPSKRNPVYTTNNGSSGHARGPSNVSASSDARAGALSPSYTGGSNSSRNTNVSRTPTTSSWSRKDDESSTAPAWNIHQYGYMGGASQGNQGISFGARRQITTQSPSVPSLAEKEKLRKDKELEAERQRQEEEEAARQRRAQREAEDARAQQEEARRWQEETQKAREAEKAEVERQKRKWEEEERQWREEEEARKKEEERAALAVHTPTTELRGQYLSDYQAMKGRSSRSPGATPEQQTQGDRVRELERQLEEAKQRERQYQLEREQREASLATSSAPKIAPEVPSRQTLPPAQTEMSPEPEDESIVSEHEYLSNNRQAEPERSVTPPQDYPQHQPAAEPTPPAAATPPTARAPVFSRPSPFAKPAPFTPPTSLPTPATNSAPRPLPASPYAAATPPFAARTDRFLSSNPSPVAPKVQSHTPAEFAGSSSAERAAEDAQRQARQQQTKAGGWASKSLLEREMERERERQREWEEQQMGKDGGTGAAGGRKVMGPRGMGGR